MNVGTSTSTQGSALAEGRSGVQDPFADRDNDADANADALARGDGAAPTARAYAASRSSARRAAASFLPIDLRAAMAGKSLARGWVVPSSQL